MKNQKTWGSALVFDVSRPENISVAREKCEHFDAAIRLLTDRNNFALSADYPGFDILTLNSSNTDKTNDFFHIIDRLIELKSSGEQPKCQEMTWNEWKTAQDSSLASKFWLYLIGNLRSDTNTTPFLQMIRDPFTSIRSVEIREQSVKRKIQIYTSEFDEAEVVKLSPSEGL